MGKLDQAKMVMKIKKVQKELEKQVISISKGDGAVTVEITAEQKFKKIHLDPQQIDLNDIAITERYIEEAIKEAISESQRITAEKMQPFMGVLGSLGL